MEQTVQKAKPAFKLNYKRTLLIGFAFFGILLLWQVYDSWCPTLLSELFARAMHPEFVTLRAQNDADSIAKCNEIIRSVQYPVGIMMAIDNLAALILLPIFGRLSDKTRTRIGKRMPYILVGTFVCAVAFPFIPLLYHSVIVDGVQVGKIIGIIILTATVVFFAMMYRNPAVALMPDITPKPLRSKANGLINIMGYIGGAFATVVGLVFVLSDYLGTKIDPDTGLYKAHTWQYHNIWSLMMPFFIASVLMLVSAIVLFLKVRENEIAEEMKEEMARGEVNDETIEVIPENEEHISKARKIMLIFILAAEFFWFMADNGVATFMGNYTIYFLGADSSKMMWNVIIGGVGSVIGFAVGGIIAGKIGRKWSIFTGLGLTLLAYLVWSILTFTIHFKAGDFPIWIYALWFIKGFGMSLVHVNSYPMVVELCPNSKIGKFTGYYYAASMLAQTITPIALGTLLLLPKFSWEFLPVYGGTCVVFSIVIFFFVKNVKGRKTEIKKGLEAFDSDD